MGEKPANIRMVFCNNHQRSSGQEGEDLRRFGVRLQNPGKQRKQGDSEYRSERDVAEDEKDCYEDSNHHQDGFRKENYERAKSCSDAFAATKAQPHWKYVTDNGHETSECRKNSLAREKPARDHDCCHAFERIQNEGDGTQPRRCARHIGGSDVAASCLTNILTVENSHQEIPKRDRADQVTVRGSEQKRGHAEVLGEELTNGKRANLLYREPPLISWLSYRTNARAVMVPNSGAGRADNLSCSN